MFAEKHFGKIAIQWFVWNSPFFSTFLDYENKKEALNFLYLFMKLYFIRSIDASIRAKNHINVNIVDWISAQCPVVILIWGKCTVCQSFI